MYTIFKINQVDSWADMEISSGNSRFTFSVSKVGDSSFTDLLRSVIKLCNGQSNAENIRMDMEAEGWLDILFLTYPEAGLKVEIYHSVNWRMYDDSFDEQPIPVPVFAAITTDHNIAYEIVKALEKYDRNDFSCWDTGFFDNELPVLKELINPFSKRK